VKNPFQPGDTKTFRTSVTADKLAEFESGIVHAVYGTFALGRDAEWACRLFVLDMKEDGEEGIGSFLSVEHVSPAPLGTAVEITATLEEINQNKVVCTYKVLAGDRLVAHGRQIQKIIQKAHFDALLTTYME
jgi:fluoroacetyl-CoA thioesterase